MTDLQASTALSRPTEFGSVILTIDHTSTREDGHVVQKFVASTEGVLETMLALFNYYGEAHLLNSAATLRLFAAFDREPFSAFIYRTKENVQIVIPTETLVLLTASHSTLLAATDALLDIAGAAIVGTDKQAGGVVPLLVVSLSQDAPAEEAPSEA